MRILFFILLPFFVNAQCPLSLSTIKVDELSAQEIKELKLGKIIETSTHEDDEIKRLQLVKCSSGHLRIWMSTDTGLHLYNVPDLASANRWMSEREPSKFYYDEVKNNPREWQNMEFKALQCQNVMANGVRCKRETCESDTYCWQHDKSRVN